ncbi:MAG: hypothetical protein PHV30_05240 [Candidatus Margulisbacteria bacterium]|nr:hypothetical protein [Candidatus Margulisiibacteriota bacterium]
MRTKVAILTEGVKTEQILENSIKDKEWNIYHFMDPATKFDNVIFFPVFKKRFSCTEDSDTLDYLYVE